MAVDTRSSREETSVEVMDDAGDRLDVVDAEVLLRDRPLKTDSRLGLGAYAVDRDRTWTDSCSAMSVEDPVTGLSVTSTSGCHSAE